MIASIVEVADLWQVVWVSLVAGIGVTAAFGLAILGSTRALEQGRNGSLAGAIGYAAIGVLAISSVAASIAFGIIVLVDK